MTLQSYSEPVAVCGVVRGTLTAYCNGFTHKSGIVITPTHGFRLKWLSVSDLVRYIVVCQTVAYPSAKLLPRTAETDSH